MTQLYDTDIWSTIPEEDLWIFDKLILSRKLGHKCGPAGVPVPIPGMYVVRPVVNLMGMGLGAYVTKLDFNTDHLPPGTFWQEYFDGRHLSVDFKYGMQIRCTQGFNCKTNLSRFTKWEITNDEPYMPAVVHNIIKRHEYVNVELVDERVIEVHLRANPDFNDGAVEIIPVWKDENFIMEDKRFRYIKDIDGDRLGFYKRYN